MRLDNIKNYIEEEFTHLGMNKRREVTRLLFEISKREQCDYRQVIKDYPKNLKNFTGFKKYLLARRFPDLSQQGADVKPYLPELDINPDYQVSMAGNRQKIIPENFFVEKDVVESPFVTSLKAKYPQSNFSEINSYTQVCRQKRNKIKDYNNRLKSFYIVKENFDFFKHCPCSPKMVPCGYHVINLGSGCAFECTYCYLQEYLNSPGIVIPANIDLFFERFASYKQNIYLGSGEYTDSLVFDHITEFSPKIVEFFRDYPKSTFEFKTKSNNIDLLRTARPAGNIVVAWSINPQNIIDSTEFYTASLMERLEAAVLCVEWGYKVAFHFDPVIYYPQWEEDYMQVVDLIFEYISEKFIDRISLGTLRMVPELKKIIENRFPDNTILDSELMIGYDKKLRYSWHLRSKIYKKMTERIHSHSPNVHVYLCMEEKTLCSDCYTYPVKKEQN